MKFRYSLLLSVGAIATISSGVGYGVYYLISSNRKNNNQSSPQWSLDSLTSEEQNLFRSIIEYHKVMINNYEGSIRFSEEVKELKKIFKDYATDKNKAEALSGVPKLPGVKATIGEKIDFIIKVWNVFEPQIEKLSLIQINDKPGSYKSLTKTASQNYEEVEQPPLSLLNVAWDIHSIFRDFKTKFTGKFADIKAFFSTKENEHLLWTVLLAAGKTDKESLKKLSFNKVKGVSKAGEALSKLNTKKEIADKVDSEFSLYMFLDVYSTIFNES